MTEWSSLVGCGCSEKKVRPSICGGFCFWLSRPLWLYHSFTARMLSLALTGVVTDPSGALVPISLIELRDNAKGIVRTASSNFAGEYSFLFLPPGSYTLTVSHADVQTTSQAVDVSVGPPVTINVRLAVAIARTVVNVTGGGKAGQTESDPKANVSVCVTT